MTDTQPDPTSLAREAAADIARRTGVDHHDVAVVLGSGWGPASDLIGNTVAEVHLSDVPGFSAPSAVGHSGLLRSVRINGSERRALVMLGRTHLYEGRGAAAVAHGVRTAAAAGCRIVVLTNGAGSLNADWPPGTPVLIRDHINLSGHTPLRGATFIDLTDLYSARLRQRCQAVEPELVEGVYVQLHGPQFETPAEISMLRVMGGDLVGMSTAIEAIAAREAGLEVLGISLVTNLAAGMSGQPLSHHDVLDTGRASAQSMGSLLARVLPEL